MSYKWLKGLILWIPTIVIGLWEYVRHAFLLPYISMDMGNVLAPVFVFLITLTLLRSLFGKLEAMQETLQQQRVMKAAFEEREHLARELHDGISQSLFMLSVKLDKLERIQADENARQMTEEIRRTVRHVHDDVRQSIANLHHPPVSHERSWMQSIHHLMEQMEQSNRIRTSVDWQMPDEALSHKQKVELLAIIREALMNIQKHAQASRILIRATHFEGKFSERPGSFHCIIEDDGIGITAERLNEKGKYGVKMMQERAKSMGWTLNTLGNEPHGTKIEIFGECR